MSNNIKWLFRVDADLITIISRDIKYFDASQEFSELIRLTIYAKEVVTHCLDENDLSLNRPRLYDTNILNKIFLKDQRPINLERVEFSAGTIDREYI